MEDLHNSVNQTDQHMTLQNHVWVKAKVQDRLSDLNGTEYEKFIGMVLDGTLQLSFKKLPLSEKALCQLHVCISPNFLHTLQPKQ